MNQMHTKHSRVLAIAPSTRGFGYALLETPEKFIDWGVKSIKGDKNASCVEKTKEIIAHYQPNVMVLEDSLSKPFRRAPRIRALTRRMITLAKRHKIKIVLLPRKRVRGVFFSEGIGTKHALAEILAKRFPEELGPRLPPKRQAWMSEDSGMDIFDAVALALAYFHSLSVRSR